MPNYVDTLASPFYLSGYGITPNMLPLGRKQGAESTEDEQDEETPTGQDAWMTIDKTVRKVDEDKVKDCTDDIDTLLVFAGLYSAVLTAFLIESYKNLLEDPQDTMVDLLRQIAFQNYTINGRSINSTATASAQPSFRVAISDIRVNVCWFASLILSLSTASYGILVKQWLREYLAIDSITPQERIRIRHFRARGLEEWRLFDIAAILPVILQVSLTLFFVGLCFFTTAVHRSIGMTSICLVSGWAFFFALAVLAPLASSRCPYKTRFLKSAFSRLRPLIHRIVSLLTLLIKRIRPAFQGDVLEGIINLTLYAIETVVQAVGPPLEDSADPVLLKYFSKYDLQEDTSIREEVEIRNSDNNDTIIFRTVDSIFLNDNLLAEMQEAMRRQPPSGEDVLKFAVAVMQHRLNVPLYGIDVNSARRIAWSWALSHPVRMSLISVVADSLSREMSKTPLVQWTRFPLGSSLEWTKDALMLIAILLSPKSPVPRIAISVFEQLILHKASENHRPGWILLSNHIRRTAEFTGCNTSDWALRVFTCISSALKALKTTEAAWAFQCIVHLGYVASGVNLYSDTDTYDCLLAQAKPNDESRDVTQVTPEIIVVLVEVAAVVLHTLTIEDSGDTQHVTVFPRSVVSLLDFVLKAIPVIEDLPDVNLKKSRLPGGIGLDMVLTDLFLTPHSVYAFLEFLSRHSDFLSTSAAQKTLIEPVTAASSSRSSAAKVKILSACADYFSAKMNSQTPSDLLFTLYFSYLVYTLPTSNTQEVLGHWHRLFTNVVACIRKICPHPGTPICQDTSLQHADTCKAVYGFLKELDMNKNDGKASYRIRREERSLAEDDVMYSQWSEQFDDKMNQVPDELVDIYRRLVCSRNTADKEGRKFWRIRRLEDMEPEPKPFVVEGGVRVRDVTAEAQSPRTETTATQVASTETLDTTTEPRDISAATRSVDPETELELPAPTTRTASPSQPPRVDGHADVGGDPPIILLQATPRQSVSVTPGLATQSSLQPDASALEHVHSDRPPFRDAESTSEQLVLASTGLITPPALDQDNGIQGEQPTNSETKSGYLPSRMSHSTATSPERPTGGREDVRAEPDNPPQ